MLLTRTEQEDSQPARWQRVPRELSSPVPPSLTPGKDEQHVRSRRRWPRALPAPAPRLPGQRPLHRGSRRSPSPACGTPPRGRGERAESCPGPAAAPSRAEPVGKGGPVAARLAGPGDTYREDSPLKLPPSSSRTLQNRMPLTKGTEESSSSSSSTRNLNFFFFIIMKAMGRGLPGGRPHARSAPRGSSPPRRPPRSAPMPGARAAPPGRTAGRPSSAPAGRDAARPAFTWQPAPPFQTRPPALRPLPATAAGGARPRSRSLELPPPGRCSGRLRRQRVVSPGSWPLHGCR